MHTIDYQYLKVITTKPKDTRMHDLYSIYVKVKKEVRLQLKQSLVEGENLKRYPHKPKMTDVEIISLAITSECLSIDSENLLISKIKSDYSHRFKNLVHRTRYSIRKKALNPWIIACARSWSKEIGHEGEDFIIDSIPIAVCKIVRAPRSTVCRKDSDTVKASHGYDSTISQFFVGYRLHLIVSESSVYQHASILPANEHDLKMLKELEFTHLSNCTLIGDKAYLSNPMQLKLFNHFNIELSTPFRENQKDYKKYPYEKAVIRKRIETCFSQYCDDFNLKKNYAKSFSGISTRIYTKISAMTFKQYWNFKNGNKISHTKHSLAA